MPTSLADVFARLVLDDANAKKQLAGLGDSSEGYQAGARIGERIKGGITKGFTAAGAASGLILSGAVESAGKFDQQLRTIQTVAMDLTDVQLAAIGDDIQGLARETGKSTDDLTAGFYDLVSAGVPAGEAIGVLRDSAKLATGALGTTAESVDLVTSALNAYGLGADQSSRVTDIFAKAVADGKVTASELGKSLAQVAPIAASAGISLEEVSAGYAVLTAKGVPAAQAATQMRSAISSLIKPNEDLNKVQEKTGINFAALAKEKGLAVALEELRKATGGNAAEMTNALGSIEAYQYALAVTGENAAGMAEQIAETGNATGLAQKQYDIASQGAEATAARAAQTVGTFLQDIGGAILPVAGPVLLTLNQLGPAFGGLISPAKLAAGAIGGIAGKAVPLLLSGIGAIIPAITGSLAAIGTAIPTIIAGAMALWPVILLAAIVAGIIFLINNPEIVAKIGEVIGAILAAVAEFLGAVGRVFSEAWMGAVAAVQRAVASIVGFILSIPGRIASWIGSILGQVGQIAGGVVSAVSGFVGSAVGMILSIPGRIIGWVASILGQAGQIVGGMVSRIGEGVGRVVGFILSIPGRIASWVGSIIGQAADMVAGFVGNVIRGAGMVVSLILGLPGRVAGFVSGFVGLAGRALSGFLGIMGSLPGKLMGIVGDAIGAAGRAISNFVSSIDINPFDGHAWGGVAEAGVPTWVGERGPEIMVPGSGSRIVPHNVAMGAIRDAAGGGGGGGDTINVYNPKPEPASTSIKRVLQVRAAMGRSA